MDKINIKNLIIGFGKAGKTLAADLAKHGEEVILVEKVVLCMVELAST